MGRGRALVEIRTWTRDSQKCTCTSCEFHPLLTVYVAHSQCCKGRSRFDCWWYLVGVVRNDKYNNIHLNSVDIDMQCTLHLSARLQSWISSAFNCFVFALPCVSTFDQGSNFCIWRDENPAASDQPREIYFPWVSFPWCLLIAAAGHWRLHWAVSLTASLYWTLPYITTAAQFEITFFIDFLFFFFFSPFREFIGYTLLWPN